MKLTVGELAGFAGIIGVYIAVMVALDLEAQSWGAFALLIVCLAALLVYRSVLKRRHG